MYACVYVCMHACMRACVCIYVCMCVRMLMYVYVRTYVYMYFIPRMFVVVSCNVLCIYILYTTYDVPTTVLSMMGPVGSGTVRRRQHSKLVNWPLGSLVPAPGFPISWAI